MEITEYATTILFGDQLTDKLFEFKSSQIQFGQIDLLEEVPLSPGRTKKILMSNKNVKFPKGHFHLDDKKAVALHSFANHELLAIEMMACALLIFPHDTKELISFKKGIVSTIRDEQKHLKLYIERLNEIGYEFGDFDLNNYFWNQMSFIKTPSEYLSVMALTFEAANLDFAFYYKKEFEKVDDFKTANILDIVLRDEISHVSFGVNFLNRWRGQKNLIEYYQENLPGNLTPARAKGKFFNDELREKAKLESEYIEWIKNFQDDFRVTTRKEWKK